ncbi:MAG: methylated-DNA--[protein]-cysteine S-methyltransferase [Chloroflexota bacterium]|nr:methylated-DNA--[protein]-cysteine S-methyltransferase [Chloroflexota bacterium]
MSQVAFAQLETALGPMLAARSRRGVAALSRDSGLEAFLGPLRRRFGGLIEPDPDALAPLARQLDEYLAQRRRFFTIALDLTGLAPFDRAVYRAALAIPYGATATYGELAARVGSPRAARAVGNAMARCPLFPIVPCHRVVRASDGFSGWGADPAVKHRLLDLEAAGPATDRSTSWRAPASRPPRPPPSRTGWRRRRPGPC